ncbi:MAG: aminopeptidase [Candidatus Eremiobacteraeota bacterium]|nr:aminopeptidase [Candidatus Eremiobacteraeota bacterium]
MRYRVIIGLLLLFTTGLSAEESGFKFKVEKQLDATPIKNQCQTNTCWAFSTSSFIESELIRMGKGRHDLSEMFVVRMVYPEKITRYVRYHGKTRFAPGSVAGDVMRVVRDYGMVPESVFPADPKPNHHEMDTVLKAALDALIENKGGQLSSAWPAAFEGILDAYLGEPPERFTYQGKEYTPRTFADEMGLRADDYVEFTSYTHHPFYQKFSLELPDNWSMNTYYNVPLEDFLSVVDSAIEEGYTLGWDGDVSEHSLHRTRGIAILPKKEWDERTSKEKADICLAPEPERNVTQEVRQEQFDNYTTNDDHLMHITGIARDQNGTKFYIIKNSSGTFERGNEGYIYMSEPYFRAKTISVLVHRDAVPGILSSKLQD